MSDFDDMNGNVGGDLFDGADTNAAGPEEPKKRNYERYLEGESIADAQPEPFLAGGFESSSFESASFEQNIPRGNEFASLGGIPAPDGSVSSEYLMPGGGVAPGNQPQPSYQGTPQFDGFQGGGYQAPQIEGLEEPVSMGEWLICFLLMMVPCVNVIMMFVWAFSKTEKKSKSNFFKAELIMMGIIFGLYLLIIIIVGLAGVGMVAAMR